MSLIGAWSFDESGDAAIDLSGGGHHFDLTANASRVAGHTTGGLAPSGLTAVPLPDIGQTTNRTVMMWIKGPLADVWPIQWYDPVAASGAWGILSISGDICIQARNATDVTQAKAPWLNDGLWHHVAGTYGGNSVRLFLDGVLAASTSLVGPLSATNAPTLFGWVGATDAVDDLRIYDSALEQSSIASAMNSPVASSDLATAASLSVGTAFLARVTAAMQQYAVAVGKAVLAAGSPSPIDKARLALARATLANPTMYATQFGWALGSDLSVDNTIDDASIRELVADAWNLIAQVPV